MAMTSTPQKGNPIIARAQSAIFQLAEVTHQPSVRRSLPAIIILSATGIALSIWLVATEPPKRPIYPGMPEAEKAQVVDTLVAAGIEAEIDPMSGEVNVSRDDYHRARMSLASAGLPQAVPDGSSVLSDIPMGTSRSIEAARLKQAQEIDLARSIKELADVSSARIHLALPEKSAFLRETSPPRASVFLQLAHGRAISSGQVEAIVNLVSSSVPGMARQDVTVIDQLGKLLSRGGDDAASLINDRQLQQRVEVENLYRRRIEALLTPLAGPGNLSVQVTAEIDFTRSEIKSERVDPTQKAIRSEQEQVQESSQKNARGVPGAISNAPPTETEIEDQRPATPEEGKGGAIRSRSSGSTRNYEISRRIETTIPASAQIKQINAAIVVREAFTPATEEGTPPVSSVNEELLADMARLAQAAIGYDQSRGDSVTVLARPFLDTIGTPEPKITEMPWLSDAVRQLGMILAITIIAFGIVRPILIRVLFSGEAGKMGFGSMGSAGTTAAIEEEVEVQEGESLDEVRARLKARQGALTKNMLDAAKSHEEQIVVIRKLVDEDAGRIATTFRQMIAEELDTVN